MRAEQLRSCKRERWYEAREGRMGGVHFHTERNEAMLCI